MSARHPNGGHTLVVVSPPTLKVVSSVATSASGSVTHTCFLIPLVSLVKSLSTLDLSKLYFWFHLYSLLFIYALFH